ncbi:hypothetical protein BV20DRAFT_1078292 [Pilatotrama ljubarskyi]|nr:hypothetical protein BV20DRAFT_1078292 [Pilatotrama ljubarskyi]
MEDIPSPLAAVFDDSSSGSPLTSTTSSLFTSNELPLPTFKPPTLHNPPAQIQDDDFLTVPHPHSGKSPTIQHLEDFTRVTPKPDPSSLSHKPWEPAFQSLLDFEFADFVLEASLNEGEANKLLKLVRRIAESPADLTFNTYKDIKNAWKVASHITPAYQTHHIQKQYGKEPEPRTYVFHYRPLFEWALSLLRDPLLANKFAWDAIRHYKFNGPGETWERFIDEPNTADSWWYIQICKSLPSFAAPLCFIVYADKTRLSSFGTQKGYPIMARLANLPAEIRNGTGYGGGQVVGFLPVVRVEDENEKRKRPFATYKAVIWHEAFWVLLKAIAAYAKTGYKFRCGDGIERILFPIILMLVPDYEEQAVMSLIRGVNGLFPCPVCRVPRDQQIVLGIQPKFPLREHADGETILRNSALSNAEKEAQMKQLGLRPLSAGILNIPDNSYSSSDSQNVFWKIPHCNVYRALSWDRLHAYHGGLFSDHLFDEYQAILDKLGGAHSTQVNKQSDAMPSWPSLNHFEAIAAIKFMDGRKYEDISKIVINASYNVLTEAVSPRGYLLLKCIRRYVVLDIIAGLEVQTAATLRLYAGELVRFSTIVQMYSARYPDKNWNFPKAHTHQHLIDDIIMKGVTANYNAKLFEPMHGSLKEIYTDCTNFKHVEGQIAEIEHHKTVAQVIRAGVNALEDARQALMDSQASPKPVKQDPFQFQHVHLGSKQAPVTLAQVTDSHQGDPDFSRFRFDLEEYLNRRFPGQNGEGWVKLKPQDVITELRYARVDYSSRVTWKLATDHLRCNPTWHGNQGRWDHVIYNIDDATVGFAQLLFIFVIIFNGVQYPTALVRGYDIVPTTRRSRLDRDLGLCRVRQRFGPPDFIPITSIIRGAFVVPDFETRGDAFVVDSVDGDMFLRLRQYVPGWDT